MSNPQDLEQIDPADMAALSAYLAQSVPDEPIKEDEPKGDSPNADDAVDPPKDLPKDPAEDKGATPGAEVKSDPTGILLKDGKTVAPYSVLQGEREKRRQAQQEAQTEREQREAAEAKARELEQAIAEMQAAKPNSKAATEAAALFTPEELAEIEADFPALKKLTDAFSKQADVINDLREKLTTQPKAEPAKADKPDAKPKQAQPTEADDDAADTAAAALHADISSRPLLSKWMAKGGALWAEAVEVDKALVADPTWRGKPRAERFAEVEKRVAADNDIPFPQATKQPAATKKATEPEEVTPPTLSDLPGKTPVREEDMANSMSAHELRGVMEKMTDDQIAAFLARAG